MDSFLPGASKAAPPVGTVSAWRVVLLAVVVAVVGGAMLVPSLTVEADHRQTCRSVKYLTHSHPIPLPAGLVTPFNVCILTGGKNAAP